MAAPALAPAARPDSGPLLSPAPLKTPPEPSASGSLALDLAVAVERVRSLIARAEQAGMTVPGRVREMPYVLLSYAEILELTERTDPRADTTV